MWVKECGVRGQMFNGMRFVILVEMFLNLVFWNDDIYIKKAIGNY